MDAKKRNEERKKAIEAKRKRLEELRKSKASAKKKEIEPSASASTSTDNKGEDTEGLNNLIEELLSKPSHEDTPPTASTTAAAEVKSPSVDEPHQQRQPVHAVKLKRVDDLGTVNLPLRKLITYEKLVQTDPMPISLLESAETDQHILESPLRRSSRKSFESLLPTEVNKENVVDNQKTEDVKELLDDEERACIEKDEGFQAFMSQGVRVMERAIKQNNLFDVTIDYGGLESVAGANTTEKLTLVETIFDERWSKDRTVTEIQSSPHHKELFLAAHTKRQVASDLDWSRGSADPNGVVLVWSTHMSSERPEYVFTAQSPVQTAKFHPYAANLVVGGCYSGQIVLWDLRAKSVPIQRSLLSPESHTHPVYSMSITGSANAHSLCSISTDGRMCIWSLANLSQPTESKMLKWNKKDISATSLAFPDGETNELCIGLEDGRIMRAQVHGSKAGIQSQSEAHFAPITSMEFHKGSSALSDLMLSSSIDWTVKLWSYRVSEQPLASFEASNDYVFDVKWNPAHPALFATVNGSGELHVWNLNVDLEVPVVRTQVNTNGVALSSLQWAGGHRILVGDAKGKVHIYDLASDIANPRRDEWTRLENTVSSLVEAQSGVVEG